MRIWQRLVSSFIFTGAANTRTRSKGSLLLGRPSSSCCNQIKGLGFLAPHRTSAPESRRKRLLRTWHFAPRTTECEVVELNGVFEALIEAGQHEL